MRYQSPKYELTKIQSTDVITSSLLFNIEEDEENEGQGNIIIDASNIFG